MAHHIPSVFYAHELVSPYVRLDEFIEGILQVVKPELYDQTKRQKVIAEVTNLVRSVASLGDATVRPFGSFIADLYTKFGDVDISVQLSQSSPSFCRRKRKENVLWDLMKAVEQSGLARNIKIIPQARVPVLLFESRRYNVSCDISVDNHLGYMKSKILKWIAEIDYRFRDMVLLIKEWAKAQDINDPKAGTLNSFSLCLLVIIHFQTCKPAILPPLKDIYEGNIVDLRGTLCSLDREIEDVCYAKIARFKSIRQRNKSTLRELLISFFEKFSESGKISSRYAICTYTGTFERITSYPSWMLTPPELTIEDPFQRPDNAARAVSSSGLICIKEAVRSTDRRLSSAVFSEMVDSLATSATISAIRSKK